MDPTENLIFLISQPRAGSTLLQRMLGSHPDIHTMSEPWIMLHPLFARRRRGITADYDAYQAVGAFESFLSSIPFGEEAYLEGIRDLYGGLYQMSLAAAGKRYFLDKTPRYYFVIPELLRTFPAAKFIILIRNPLAVLSSILETWVKRNWPMLQHYRNDLLTAPRLLLDGIGLLGDRAIVVHYEQLVCEPAKELARISERIGISFMSSMVDYGRSELPQWSLGDPATVYRQQRPDAGNAEKWISALDDAQSWKLLRDYLAMLGPDTIQRLGYQIDEIDYLVDSRQPNSLPRLFTIPLAWLLNAERPRKMFPQDEIILAATSLQQRGLSRTVAAGGRRLISAMSNTR